MLRTRLFLNLTPFAAILLAIGALAIVLFSRLAGSVDASVRDNYQSVAAAQSMSLAVLGMEKVLLQDAEEEEGAAEAAFIRHQQRFEENLQIQLRSITLPREQELTDELVTAYRSFLGEVTALRAIRNAETRQQHYAQEFVPRLLSLLALLDRIRDLNNQAILGTNRSIQQIAGHVTRLMGIGMAVALILFAYASYRLGRSILQPIKALTRATGELGAGRLEHPVPVVSRDELGQLAKAFNQMAAQLHAYRQSTSDEIVRLHRTMESTLASFPDPIFVLNETGGIELKNPAAEALAASLQIQDRLPAHLQEAAAKVLSAGENFLPHSFKEVVSFRLNGEEKSFLPRILAMRNKAQALFGVAVVLYEVTRFRLLDHAKTDLVATVSHELKTPLTSVRMVLHLLLEKTIGPLTPKQGELLETAREDTERLLRILNDLLDLTRLEEGHSELHLESVAPAELVRQAGEEMREAIAAGHLRLRVELPAAELPAVWVDRQRVNHVFTNLISNAIKHSPAGAEILVRAAATETGEVQFSVLDEGPGVPDEYKVRIFDRFFRVPGQQKSGAGLGLSIAREIVLAHGGHIAVKRRPGQGSEFYFVLKTVQAE